MIGELVPMCITKLKEGIEIARKDIFVESKNNNSGLVKAVRDIDDGNKSVRGMMKKFCLR